MKSPGIDFQITDNANRTVPFETLASLAAFLQTEIEFWKRVDGGRVFFLSYQGLENGYTSVVKLIKLVESDEFDTNSLKMELGEIRKSIGNNWLWSAHPYVNTLIECQKLYGIEAAKQCYSFIVEKRFADNSISTKPRFIGNLIGYEYMNQGSDIAKRSISERASLEQLRDELDNAKNTLINEVEQFKASIHKWNADRQKELIDQAQQHNEKFNTSLEDWAQSFDELEMQYFEKIRMSAPAKYWSQSAASLKSQGELWAWILFGSVVVGLILFSLMFYFWLNNHDLPIQLNTVQGIVIFATILATFAFLIRTLSRLTFSAFHLMRDAEERKQLTYLYLSLSNRKAVDEKSRDIVLQALFSRSESGLLAGESGPTMPGVGEIINNALKGK